MRTQFYKDTAQYWIERSLYKCVHLIKLLLIERSIGSQSKNMFSALNYGPCWPYGVLSYNSNLF